MTTRGVLITGTSTGIGAAATARLAGDGWRVYAGVRREEDGERLTSEIDGDVVPLILDVTNREQIDKSLARIEADLGRLHGLVNNAGVGVGGLVELLPDEEWQYQFDVNFFGLVTLTREAFPLVDKANGRFVHIGSIAGRVGAAGLGPYTASKHALEGFNWALRAELRETGMTSSLIEPGEIKTAIWDKADESLDRLEDELVGDLVDRYQFVTDGIRGFSTEGRKRGIDPDKVAKAIEHALTASRPKARYLVGPDAKAAGAVFAKLPDRMREGVLGLNAKRLEKMGRKLR